jgi:flagellar motor switch protein FliM
MSETLNPDKIAAMFEAAKSGQAPEGGSGHRRAQRLRSVDFSRPTKFTAEHQRRIARILETFCLGAASRLTAELRTPTEFEVINTNQVTWSAAQPLAPAHSLGILLVIEPLGTRMLMTIESSWALEAIERLLGSSEARATKQRRFTEIDWTLSRRLMDAVSHQLSLAFHDVGGLRFMIEEIEQQTDTGSVTSVSEPTFVVTVEVRMQEQSSTMTLMFPWESIAPIAEDLTGRELQAGEDDLSDSGMDLALAAAPITLRAEVASMELPVADILALTPGHIIRFGTQASEGVSLYAENVKLGSAQPGSNGHRRAVQIPDRAEV